MIRLDCYNRGTLPLMAARLFVAFLLMMGASSAQAPAEYRSSVSAEHWMSICRPLLEAKSEANGHLEVSDTFEVGQCSGGFETLSLVTAVAHAGKPVLGVCPPTIHTLPQWIAIFTKYAENHPKRYTEPWAFVAIAALQEAYPCGKK